MLHRRPLLLLVLAALTASLACPAFMMAEDAAAKPEAAAPLEFVPGSWSLVFLPDVQNYSDRLPGLYTLQTHWIAKNRDKCNIQYVATLGDFTNGDRDYEWRHVKEAMEELDGKVPYALVTGNHDYAPQGDSISGTTGLNQVLPASKFKDWPTFGGTKKEGDISNSYHLFSAGGVDWILLALEWAPNNDTVQWANDVLAKHPQRKAIMATHAYMYDDGCRYDFATKKESQKWNPHTYLKAGAPVNDGEELWQKLVRKNNFALVVSGHVCNVSSDTAYLTSENDRNKKVHQMLVDYQGRKLGGEAYLRILEFLPDGKTVHVKSYSPLYDNYLTDPCNQFTFELDP